MSSFLAAKTFSEHAEKNPLRFVCNYKRDTRVICWLLFWYMFVFRCTADSWRAWGVEPGEFSPPGVWEHPGWPAVLQRGWPGDQRCKEKHRDTAWQRILNGNLWIRSVMPNMAAVPSLTPKPRNVWASYDVRLMQVKLHDSFSCVVGAFLLLTVLGLL